MLLLCDVVYFLQMSLGNLLRGAHFSADSATPGGGETLNQVFTEHCVWVLLVTRGLVVA